MRKRLVWAVLAMCLLTVGAVQADAQTELEQARASVAATTERLEDLLADLEAAQRRGDELAGHYWQVESNLAATDSEIAVAIEAVEDLEVKRQALRGEVRVIALDQYMTGAEVLGVADHEREADRAAAETLARLVVGADNAAIDELFAVATEYTRAREELEAQREDQQLLLDDVEATQSQLFAELDQLAMLRVEVDQELTSLESALADLEAAEAERQAVAAEQARIAEERRRAEAAAVAAAAQARAIPTPAPTATSAPTSVPTPAPEPTVPNPQPSEPQPSEPLPEPTVPNPQPSEPQSSEPQSSEPLPEPTVPNPQPSEPQPSEPLPEPTVPNPQPSEPLPTESQPTPVPNPQPSAPVTPAGGGIVCPLAGPFTHTDDFNAPRAVGGVHRANDLISAQGTPVIAVASGVLEHKESRVGGLSAHLKGDNGDYYFYTHLSGYENVGAGRVPAGTVIGYVGMTGNAPIPHLHFEIHRGGYGNYSNPYGPVRAACF